MYIERGNREGRVLLCFPEKMTSDVSSHAEEGEHKRYRSEKHGVYKEMQKEGKAVVPPRCARVVIPSLYKSPTSVRCRDLKENKKKKKKGSSINASVKSLYVYRR